MGWIADNYGSKKGMLRHFGFRAGWRFHPIARQPVDLGRGKRLVFVCKGNICRSALAESVATTAGFAAISYGFRTTPGMSADPRMQAAATILGYNLSMHQTTEFTDYEADHGDIVLFFEPQHLRELKALGTLVDASALLGAWSRPRSPYIHDPYGGSPAYYARVASVIQQSVLALLADIEARNAG